jgi:hypothetical protein
MHADPSRVENSAQGSSCQLKFVNGSSYFVMQATKINRLGQANLQILDHAEKSLAYF